MDVRRPLMPDDRSMLELAFGYGLGARAPDQGGQACRGAARAALQAVQSDSRCRPPRSSSRHCRGTAWRPRVEGWMRFPGPGKKPRLTQRSQPGKTNPVLGMTGLCRTQGGRFDTSVRRRSIVFEQRGR